jgi:hypothetical protein
MVPRAMNYEGVLECARRLASQYLDGLAERHVGGSVPQGS